MKAKHGSWGYLRSTPCPLIASAQLISGADAPEPSFNPGPGLLESQSGCLILSGHLQCRTPGVCLRQVITLAFQRYDTVWSSWLSWCDTVGNKLSDKLSVTMTIIV